MSSSVEILEKNDDAIKAFIKDCRGNDLRYRTKNGQMRNLPIYVPWEDEDPEIDYTREEHEIPCIVVASEEAAERETIHNSGNFDVLTAVEVVGDLDKHDRKTYRAWVGKVGAILHSENLPTLVNALPAVKNFTMRTWTRGSTIRGTESDYIPGDFRMVTRFEATAYCYPS